MSTDWHDIIQRHMAGITTEEEAGLLQDSLKRDDAFASLYLRYMNLDVALEAQATTTEATRTLLTAPAIRRRGFQWRPLTTAAVASVLLAGFLAVLFLPQVSAAALVRQALKVHAAALDRCYRVSASEEFAPRRQAGLPSATREILLWTRGDRFWVESRVGEKSAAWGRDEQGRVWFTSSPNVGAWFEADEVPERLAQVCELRSLQPEALLHTLLVDFDLRREPDTGGSHVIHAELKPGHTHTRYHAALLEVDSTSSVLSRVVVHRVVPGRSPVPVVFTLVESSLHDESSYTLAGHLSQQNEIYDRHSAPGKRGQALADFLQLVLGSARNGTSPDTNR